jgi:hypothetical protein
MFRSVPQLMIKPVGGRGDLLKDLATWPLALEEVAHAQSQQLS